MSQKVLASGITVEEGLLGGCDVWEKGRVLSQQCGQSWSMCGQPGLCSIEELKNFR